MLTDCVAVARFQRLCRRLGRRRDTWGHTSCRSRCRVFVVTHVARVQVYERASEDAMDDRFFAAGQKIPFGVDPNKLPDSMSPW